MATTEEDIQERYLDKVAKLLAKAESTTPEEAEALTEKATALMLEHSIEMAMVEARRKGVGAPEKIIERRIDVGGIYWQAHRDLGTKIGQAFGFKLIWSNWSSKPKMKGTFTWVGYESDIEKAEILYTSLLIQCATALRPFAKDWKDKWGHLGSMEGFKARRSFIFGFAEAIGMRLRKQHSEAVANAVNANDLATDKANEGTPGVALVLVARDERLKDYYDEKYGNLRAGRASRLEGGVAGRGAGIQAGHNANLGATAVNGSRKALRS